MADASGPSPVIVVAAALIGGDGRVLVQRRPLGKPEAGLWEFPGGKVEAGETPEAALARELAEELAIAVAPGALRPVSFASEAGRDRHLLLLLYACREWEDEPRAVEAAGLRWVTLDEAAALAMPHADVALVAALAGWLGRDQVGVRPSAPDPR